MGPSIHPDTVARVIQDVCSEMGTMTARQREIVDEVRAFALGADLRPEDIASLSYRIGFHIVGNGGHGPMRSEAGHKLMALINYRHPEGITLFEREAARKVIAPSVWELL